MDRKINILHGTDWWTDCDDIANTINLLCVGIDSVMEDSAPSLSAFLENEGVRVPIGVDREAMRDGKGCKYQHLLAQYPHRVCANDACEEAWILYRRTLACLDGKADITEVGFPQIIMQLLRSGPDAYSPLTGIELVKQKVNRIWLMAGRWDESPGSEYNLTAYPECREAGHYICERSPVPLVFLGYEVGLNVITGNRLADGDLLKIAFTAHGSPNGRHSWDPMLTAAAVAQDLTAAGYRAVCGKAHVDPLTGKNTFTPGNGTHCYLVKTQPDSFYSDRINETISSAP